MPALRNPREEDFCRAFVRLRHGTKAAVEAGYSSNGAAVRGSELLSKPRIKDRVEELRADKRKPLEKEVELTASWLIKSMRKLAEEAIEDGDRPAAMKALELLGRECGVFQPNSKLEISNRSPLDGMTTTDLLALVKSLETIDNMQRGQQLIDVTPTPIDAEYCEIDARKDDDASDAKAEVPATEDA
jgi:hypothetical protein